MVHRLLISIQGSRPFFIGLITDNYYEATVPLYHPRHCTLALWPCCCCSACETLVERVFIMHPTSVGRGIMKWWPVPVYLSVCLSVACLDLTRERKGLGNPKLAGWKPITSRDYLKSKRSKVKVTRPVNAVIDNAMHDTEIGGNSRDAKMKVKAYSIN